jgi:CheY-like chemotaxis protein
MIVDDSVDQVELLQTVFKMVDPSMKIVSAKDGIEAMRLLRADLGQLPKVILLDIKMPRESGHDILSEIKADTSLKRIPVCMFSSGDDAEDIREAYERGASFYFKKPNGFEDLRKFAETFNEIWYNFASHPA